MARDGAKQTDEPDIDRLPTLLQWKHCSQRIRRIFGDFVYFEVAIFLGIGGFTMDCMKPMFFPEFVPLHRFGFWLYVFYFLFDFGASLLALWLSRVPKRRYLRYLLFGISIWSAGIFNVFMIEGAMIPLVWHGILGFIGAVTVGFNHGARDMLNCWVEHAPKEADSKSLEVRKELQKEKQWAFTTYVQIMVAFSAIFGVEMTILFRAGNINSADLKATGIQMTTGFCFCVLTAYLWGISPALAAMRWMRRNWLT